MQIIVGAPIPKNLLAAGYTKLRSQSSKTYKALDAYARTSVCTDAKMASVYYANQSNAVTLQEAEVARVPSRVTGVGRMGPARSGCVQVGVKDVLCVFVPDKELDVGGHR